MVTIPRPGATATVAAVVGAGDTAAALGTIVRFLVDRDRFAGSE